MFRVLSVFLLLVCVVCGDIVTLFPFDDNPARPVQSLNGIWRFRPDYANVGLTKDWYSSPLPTDSLTIEMPVPSSWNDVTQNMTLFKHIGVGWYERNVAVSSGLLSAGRVVLRFGSANYHTRVWLNGKEVTNLAHDGGHLPFEADVTAFFSAGPGVYRLTARVDATLDRTTLPPVDGYGSMVDFFDYGGIDRPVLLYTTSTTFISDITVFTDAVVINGTTYYNMGQPAHGLGSAARVHHRKLRTRRHSGEAAAQASTISASLHYAISVGGDMTEVASVTLDLIDPSTGSAVVSVTGFNGTFTLDNAQLWQPCGMPSTHNCTERTFSYSAQVKLLNAQQTVIDSYTLPYVGVRVVEVSGTQFLINGQPFYFHGINKHDDNLVRGKGYDPVMQVKDQNLVQWLHANSFRTSHYPYPEEWYMFADEFGLCVIDEIPAVGMEADDFSATTLTNHEAFALGMYSRDKNHPAVVMWSLFNEPVVSGTGVQAYFMNMSTFMRSEQVLAPRPVTFVNYESPNHMFDYYDVLTINRYNGWYSQLDDLVSGISALRSELQSWHSMYPTKPLMLTEFGCDTVPGLHADPPTIYSEEFQISLYNAYYGLLDEPFSREFVVGELPWNFADFATGVDMRRITNLNRKGIFTRDRQPKAAAFVIRDRYTNMDVHGPATGKTKQNNKSEL